MKKLGIYLIVFLAGEASYFGMDLWKTCVNLRLVEPIKAGMRTAALDEQAQKAKREYYRDHPEQDPAILNPAPAEHPTELNPITISRETPFVQLTHEQYIEVRDAIMSGNRWAIWKFGRKMSAQPKATLPKGTQYTPCLKEEGNPLSAAVSGDAMVVSIRNKNGSVIHGLLPEDEYWMFIKTY